LRLPPVQLPGGARPTSRLGFGCSALVGGRTPEEAQRLLETALDAGITHFDVARVYGTGDAEGALGRFAARHRDEITIATKFGIDPLPPSPGVDVAKRMVRFATRRSRKLLGAVRRHAPNTVRRGLFSGEKARVSLEVSLGELGTDRVDLFLLHDCSAADWERGDVMEALDRLRGSGRIGAYGPATELEEVRAIAAGPGRPPEVVQFGADLLTTDVRAIAGHAVPVTHGGFRGLREPVSTYLARDRDAAARWSRIVGEDLTLANTVGAMLFAGALKANPEGIVLFSSGDADRIKRNAAIARDEPFEPAQLDELARLVRSQLGRDS
jgi:hypothetical protein